MPHTQAARLELIVLSDRLAQDGRRRVQEAPLFRVPDACCIGGPAAQHSADCKPSGS